MPNPQIKTITADGVTYDIVDKTSGYLTSYTETDPTVPSWAKELTKPSYSLNEITGTSDLQAIEALTGTTGLLKKTAADTWTLDTNTYLTSFTETDPVFSASAAAGITSSDITNWNSLVSDDHKWNDVALNKSSSVSQSTIYVPFLSSTTATSANIVPVVADTTGVSAANRIPKYNNSGYLVSTTPSIDDDSTKVATTAFVQDAIEGLPTPMQFIGTVGTSGTVTWANLPTAASTNEGYTYKVITDHTAETGKPAAKVGDTIISNGTEWIVVPSGDEPSGTVMSIAAGSGLTTDQASAGPITGSGTISHADTSSQASSSNSGRTYIQSVTLDDFGHVTGLSTGTETVTVPSATGSNTTGITIGDHSTTTIYGVKSGTNSTTTASKASGANGTAPTLGTPISIYGVKSGTNSTTTASKVTVGSHSTDYGITAAGSGSFTQGSFSGGSFSATVTNHVLSYSFTAATHGSDSHTHTAPTLGSKVPTVSASDVTVPIRADDATSIPNVTNAGSASTWSFTDVTVPIRADDAITVVTSKTHTVNDSGHTHTI